MNHAATEPARAKLHAETDLQWKMRIAAIETERLRGDGPIMPIEATHQADYRREFVMHIESQTLARTMRNRSATPLLALFDRGAITQEQLKAAEEIAGVVEMRGRAVSVQCASLEARVDNGGPSTDILAERIGRVRLELSYSRWRDRLPHPKLMILEMLLKQCPLKHTAARYRMGWPRAKARLVRALESWIEIRLDMNRRVDQRDLDYAHLRIMRKAA